MRLGGDGSYHRDEMHKGVRGKADRRESKRKGDQLAWGTPAKLSSTAAPLSAFLQVDLVGTASSLKEPKRA